VVKVRTYGALMGALLTIASVETAEAAECKCAPEAPKHQAAQPTPRPAARSYDNGRAYAQSGYDYRSSSRVTETFVRRAAVAAPAMVRPAPMMAPPMAYDDGFRVAPNDERVRYFRDEKVVYGPMAYAPPPQAYYPPPDDGYGPPPFDPQDGFETGYDLTYDTGGVGYSGGFGGGGGRFGGMGGPMRAYLNDPNASGSDVPPNGGGVNLPPGYGPYYNGGWQGPPVPTSGGLGRK
jgi:hypothetical protein